MSIAGGDAVLIYIVIFFTEITTVHALTSDDQNDSHNETQSKIQSSCYHIIED